MAEKGTTWEEFCYDYIETGWFDHQRRPKTTTAMEHVWKALPQEALDRLSERKVIVFAPPVDELGHVYPWFERGIREEGDLVYLAPSLERKSQSEVDTTVAHEFAHVVLGHGKCNRPTTYSTGYPSRQADVPHEIEADKLVEKWGFKPAYKRPKKKKTTGRAN